MMATATLVSRTVIDHEPNGSADISVSVERDNGPWIIVKQDEYAAAMRIEHAEAVHAALGACIAETKAILA